MLKLAGIAVLAVGSLNPLAVPSGACEVSGMTVSWGFKESFRSYISGSIAVSYTHLTLPTNREV